jgi:hypothetical protein
LTNERTYLKQSYVYFASFLHNTEIWESRIQLAVHYRNFLGVTCLQDAPYMAIYEVFDSFAAFERYLDDAGTDVDPTVRMLIVEFCKYALDSTWYYYPDALPPEALSPTQRETNGHIDRKLSFPLEDLYADGQPAGQVGQEVYGAGAAFIFATRAFHHVDGAPFRLYCDHIGPQIQSSGDGGLSIVLEGDEACVTRIALLRLKRRKLGTFVLKTAFGASVEADETTPDRVSFVVPANGRYLLSWH